MQNLSRPPDGGGSTSAVSENEPWAHGHDIGHYSGGDEPFGQLRRQPTEAQMAANLPGISTYWEHPYQTHQSQVDEGGVSPVSPVDGAFQMALPPDIQQTPPMVQAPGQTPPAINEPYDSSAHLTPYYDDPPNPEFGGESDRVPLTSMPEPIAGTSLTAPPTEAPGRDSFQTVPDLDGSPSRDNTNGNGRDNHVSFYLEPGLGNRGERLYGQSLTPAGPRRTRSPSTSGALYRAGSIVRAMSQRVVMISGEAETLEQMEQRRQRSRSPSRDDGRYRSAERQGGAYHGGQAHGDVPGPMLVDTSYQPQMYTSPMEKLTIEPDYNPRDPLPPRPRRGPMPNPLKGKSLGIFSPESHVRRWLCNVLVMPFTETLILVLIVTQAILLAVEAAPNVFRPGNGRPERWAGTPIEWAMLGLFSVFTVELLARIIVSGFILNAAEYSTIDRQRGIKGAVTDQYRAIFQPQRFRSVRGRRDGANDANIGPSAFARSFTLVQGQALPETVEEQQRFQLARRAFLRHGFNRLDFIAVVSYWISFVLSITGIEHEKHMYVFRFLSCLRIVRLLALTSGTSVSLDF